METVADVIIVGAGPAGLATAACLLMSSISFIILEKDGCYASLWKTKAYDRLKLHLARRFCALPYFPFPKGTPTFVPRETFIRYLDDYVQRFDLKPVHHTMVVSAAFDADRRRWLVDAKNTNNDDDEVIKFSGKFLVVATGENAEPAVPKISGISSFSGKLMHSVAYKSGAEYAGKNVLVVGAGNSGMEIAYDLSNFGAKTSILVRSPFHVTTKWLIYLAMTLFEYLPVHVIDWSVCLLTKIYYGDLSKYGIIAPVEGPFAIKMKTGRSAVIDVGTINKIKSGEVQVFNTAISKVEGDQVVFENGRSHPFDAIICATGYRSKAYEWLQDGGDLLNENGFPSRNFPNHWKGKNGVYCAGLARRGLAGVTIDAKRIAEDISEAMKTSRT